MKGWKAKNVKQLIRRICKCIKQIDTNGVQRFCEHKHTKLCRVADHGPFIEIY